MTDKEIVERAKAAEKRIEFRDLVSSLMSSGVNSPYGIGFIEGMVEYRSSLPEEPVSDDLEEAARRYAALQAGMKDAMTSDFYDEYPYSPADVVAFKVGANWQKQQMMKDSVSAYIRRNKYTKRNVLSGFDIICDEIQKFKDKDHVKVIIIKNE